MTEVHTFDQDDLLSEDVMILDTYTEIFAWVGQNADPNEKQQAFDIAQVCVSHEWMRYRSMKDSLFVIFLSGRDHHRNTWIELQHWKVLLQMCLYIESRKEMSPSFSRNILIHGIQTRQQ